MLNIKGKKSEGYSSTEEITNFRNRLKYKNIYYCLSRDSGNTNRNDITINKDDKKYYILKNKWNKLLDQYPFTEGNIFYPWHTYIPNEKEIISLPDEYKYADFEGLVHVGDVFAYFYKMKDGFLGFRNTENLITVRAMFYHNEAIEYIPYVNTKNAQNFFFFIACCYLLKKLDWSIDLLNANDMTEFAWQCASLKEITLLNLDRNNNKIVGNQLFDSCNSLNKINGLYTTNFTTFSQAFMNCTSLTSIPFEIDLTSCIYVSNMFKNCPATDIKLKNVPTTLDLSNIGTTNYTVLNYI